MDVNQQECGIAASQIEDAVLSPVAYWIGYKREVASAAQQANDRWLPQAESVIFRLMTLHANVCRFSRASRSTCSTAECDLPELKDDALRAVRIKLKTDCEASGQRLDDIANQLEDAVEDWSRFIGANCAGEECLRIFEAIERRKAKLQEENAADISPEAVSVSVPLSSSCIAGRCLQMGVLFTEDFTLVPPDKQGRNSGQPLNCWRSQFPSFSASSKLGLQFWLRSPANATCHQCALALAKLPYQLTAKL